MTNVLKNSVKWRASLCLSKKLEPSSAVPKIRSGRYRAKKLTTNWNAACPRMFCGTWKYGIRVRIDKLLQHACEHIW